MNLYLVTATGWGTGFDLVEADSEEEAMQVACPHRTGLYTPAVVLIELRGMPGVRWSYEYSPDSERDE